jgi:hypothetical protein
MTTDPFQELVETAQARTLTVEEEIMRHIHAMMPWGQSFTLANGQTVTINKFTDPRERDGTWQFGFDVSCDAFHLEFQVHRTGWGRALGGDVGISDETDEPGNHTL